MPTTMLIQHLNPTAIPTFSSFLLKFEVTKSKSASGKLNKHALTSQSKIKIPYSIQPQVKKQQIFKVFQTAQSGVVVSKVSQ